MSGVTGLPGTTLACILSICNTRTFGLTKASRLDWSSGAGWCGCLMTKRSSGHASNRLTTPARTFAASVCDIPQRESLLRVPTLEPTRGTHGHVSHILEASPDAASLIDALTDD